MPPLTTAAMCRVLQFRSLAVYYTWTRLRDEAREHALVLLREHHLLIHFFAIAVSSPTCRSVGSGADRSGSYGVLLRAATGSDGQSV